MDELYMQRCIELAASGLGSTTPNPMVGSVIVYQGKVIGEGYHQQYGQAHAEVNAINSVANKELLKESSLYVNLEPCSHFGKTPPCCELIARMQIPRVVIGTADPNPLVLGKGIDFLQKAGCQVTIDILKQQCMELNKRFFTFHKYNRPYIILKWAETADGFVDKLRKPEEKPDWITNDQSRILVHKWRTEEQAIMIGTNTASMDNPRLNVREWSGKNPIRIVLDNNLRLHRDLHIFDGTIPTIVYTSKTDYPTLENVQFVMVDFRDDLLTSIMNHLYCSKILSIIVEGGTQLINSLIRQNYWDEARVFIGSDYFFKGISAPKLNRTPVFTKSIEGVKLNIFGNNYTTE